MAHTKRENVHVVARFRPLNAREKKEKGGADFKLVVKPEKNLVRISRQRERHEFVFDYVLDETVGQEELFNKVAKESVEYVAEGYNATIFAYGVTSSGKTYTMFGEGKNKGVIPRACDHLFHTINDNEDVIEANVKCSFLEIYREHIRDLLKQKEDYVPSLRIRQHQKKGVYVQGLIEKYVYTPQEIIETIQEGAQQRSTSSTALNNVSSRSHAVLTLNITQILTDGTEILSKLHMIDLAGSENVGKSEASGVTLLEAQQINKSLSSLGNVIYALTEKGRDHVPYRDSRLTYLLQDSLGGNSKTILITTATPHFSAYAETLNTLKFAQRAKEIKNIPTVNRNQSNANLVRTVANLTRQLSELQSKYDDAKAILEKVEEGGETDAVTKTKCEQLEQKLQGMKQLQEDDAVRKKQFREIFNKQRDLAQSTALELYNEKMRVRSLTSELEQYKQFYETLKDSLSTPNVLEMIVKDAKIVPSSLYVDSRQVIQTADIDSPI